MKKKNLFELAEGKTVAIAHDKAFNFYYRENIEIFEKLGIEIKYFSPLEDVKVPTCDFVYIGGGFPEIFAEELEKNESIRKSIFDLYENNTPIYAECGGLMYLGFVYIGGGFPEIFAEELEKNESIRKSIFDLYENNTPIYAECGGLMYLGKSIIDKSSVERSMVGIFEGVSEMTPRLRRFGYCEGKAIEKTVISKEGDCIRGHEFAIEKTVISKEGDCIRGHEFHHSIFKSDEKCAYKMRKIRDGKVVDEWEGGYSKKNTLATYLHTHFYNNLDCIENILKNCER